MSSRIIDRAFCSDCGSARSRKWQTDWVGPVVQSEGVTGTSEKANRRQHHIPASALGLFSDQPARELRTSRLHVVRRGVPKPFVTTAEKVGWSRDAYEYQERTPENDPMYYSIDALWTGYEADVPQAIRALVDDASSLSGRRWLHCLVPFAAAALVRSPEFLSRFSRRMLGVDPAVFNERDNALSIIVIELWRLLALVMAGSWTVIKPAPGKHFIANDRGWYLIGADERATPGFFIPLTPNALLHVRPKWRREILRSNGIQWMAVGFEEMQFDENQTDFANHCVALFALSEIYGPDESSLEAHRDALSEPPSISDIDRMGFPWGRVASPTQLDWMRAACLCMASPGSRLFRPPQLPPNELWERLPLKLPIIHFVDAPNDTSGLFVSESSVVLELFREPFLCAPVAMDNTARLLESRLLQTLFHRYVCPPFEEAEDELRLVLASRDTPPLNERDHRYDFMPTRLPTARTLLDGEFVRGQMERESKPGKTFERGPDALFTADLRLRLGKP